MGFKENKNVLDDAKENMLQLYTVVIDEMVKYENNLWNNVVKEDAAQQNEKHRILINRNSFKDLDIQAAQKLFCYSKSFAECFKRAFCISNIDNDFKNNMYKSIGCRNELSHETMDLSVFSDDYTDEHLRNYKKIARYLSSICPAASSCYERFCNLFDRFIPQYAGHNTFSISSIKQGLYPNLTEKEILHACIECDLNIADNAIRAVKLDDIKNALSEYFRKQEEKHPYLEDDIKPSVANFIGREDLFEKINAGLSEDHIVAVYGMGGMGKSCAALKYAKDHKKNYRHIQYVFFEKSLRTTIRKLNFNGLTNESEMDDDRKYENRMEILKKYGKGSLLIIDNMDVGEDEHYMDLLDLSCDIIITTRCNINGAESCTIPIMPLTENDQITLFKCHYFGSDNGELSEDESHQLKDLLDLINGHTLLIELSAKVIKNGSLDFHNISEYLTEDKDVSDEVRVTKDNKPTQYSLDGYLNRLFDATQRTDREKHILSLMTLVPLDGIPQQLFKELAKLKDNNDINDLKNSSWIHSVGVGKDARLSLHPMISKAIRNRIPVKYSNAQDFISNIKLMLHGRSEEYNSLLCSIAKNIVMYVTLSDKEQLENGIEFSKIVFDNMQFKNASLMLDRLVEEEKNAADPDVRIKFYKLRGDVYVRLANYDGAINAYTTAIDLYKNFKGSNSEYSIWTLFNLRAFVFRKKSDYKTAMGCYEMAMRGLENEVDSDPSLLVDLATTYNDMGIVYLNQKDYDKALEYYRKGLEIRQKLDGDHFRDLAYSYHNIGTAYQKKGEYQEAKKYHEIGLQIRKKNVGLPENHPDVMSSLTQLGNDCVGLKDYNAAWEYINNALQIRLKHFGEYHPDVAWSYFSIAQWYKAKGDIENARSNLQKCIEIRVKVLGEDHKYTINAKKELAALCSNQ